MTHPLAQPQQLSNGLTLRWATAADAEAIAQFNGDLHSDNPPQRELGIYYWTLDLMSGRHPTVQPEDFTVVVHESGKIISSVMLISQTWSYEGLPFDVGRPELVATLPDYRRRGLIRQQMEMIHAKSAARGEMVQAITGIPWYYRQFGYEMTMNLGGSRRFIWNLGDNHKMVDPEPYQLRPATVANIPLLDQMYATFCAASPIACLRHERIWQHQLNGHHEQSNQHREYWLMESSDGQPLGYFALFRWEDVFVIDELGVFPGESWRELCLFIGRVLKRRADELNPTLPKPIWLLSYRLGDSHPAYTALGRQLVEGWDPYAWYLRVPDVPAFLRHISPVLERRLAQSVMAKYTGSLRLNLRPQNCKISFEKGQITEIAPYPAQDFFDEDAALPDHTFLHLLFGHRTVAELKQLRVDCYAETAGTEILLNILFPKKTTCIFPLA